MIRPEGPPVAPPVESTPAPGAFTRRLHQLCLRVRPTELGALLKVAFRVRRRYVRTEDGLWFWVDPASQLGHELVSTGTYEPSMAAVLRAVLRPRDSFVDVGANEGLLSVLAASLTGDGPVVAVEPQSRLAPVLLRNLEINGCGRVSVRSVALDGSPGWARLWLRPTTNPGASGTVRRRLDVRTESVPAVALDDLLDDEGLDRVRLLKVDCEGAEEAVMAGATSSLAAQRFDYIAMEYHPTVGDGASRRSTKLHQRLLDAGYTHSLVGDRHVYHRPGGEDALRSLGSVTTGAPFTAEA